MMRVFLLTLILVDTLKEVGSRVGRGLGAMSDIWLGHCSFRILSAEGF